MVKKVQRRPSALAAQQPANETSAALTSASDKLFNDASAALTLRDGTVLVVNHAKTRHVGLMLDFFHALVKALSKDQLVKLVSLIEERRTGKKVEGEDAKQDSVEDLVTKVFDKTDLFITLFHAVYGVLPTLVASLSNISPEKFEDLDADEGMAVTYRIFADNYGFFSRNLPLMARVFFQLVAEKTTGK